MSKPSGQLYLLKNTKFSRLLMPGDEPVDSRRHANLAVHLAHDAGHAIYILVCDKVISTVVLTERKGSTTYISYVDSSGYNRGFSTNFIVAVLRSIPGLAVCFSHPKKEPVLGRSSENPGKNIMGPRELFGYWCRAFGKRCSSCQGVTDPLRLRNSMGGDAGSNTGRGIGSVMVKRSKSIGGDACYMCTWSNFTSLRSCPYKSLDEIETFDDDPKSKMISSFRKVNSGSLSDVFEGLLARSDFSKGGLLFSRCLTGRTMVSSQSSIKNHTETQAPASDACKEGAKGVAAGFEEENALSYERSGSGGEDAPGVDVFQKKIEEAVSRLGSASPVSSVNRVFQMKASLQASDFSNEDEASRSTERFVEEFGIFLRYFRVKKSAAKSKETVSKIAPRTKK